MKALTECILVSDVFLDISDHVDIGSTWKSWIFTCKYFNSMNSKARIKRYSNHNDYLVRPTKCLLRELLFIENIKCRTW
jgi:hypothetical protein